MQRSIIGLMLTLALSLLMGPRATNAQQPGHVPRIAVLNAGFPPAASTSTPFLDAFRHELRERGWVERILSLKETCRLHARATYAVLVDAVSSFFHGQPPDLSWINAGVRTAAHPL